MAEAKRNVTIGIGAVDNTKSAFSQVGARLEALKRAAGEESTFGRFGKVLMGAGAAGGIALITRAMADASEKAVTLKDAFLAGEIGAHGLADEAARSIPVLGNIYRAGRSIRELFVGTIRETREELAAANREAEVLERRRKLMNDVAAGASSGLSSAKLAFGRAALTGGDLTRFNAAAEFEQNSAIAAKLKADAIRAGNYSGAVRDEIDSLARYYGAIFQAARVRAEEQDFEARQRMFEERAQKDAAALAELSRRVEEQAAARASSRRAIFDSLIQQAQGRRDAFAESMITAPRGGLMGATAPNIGGPGLSDVVAATATRTVDPGVQVAREQKEILRAINAKLEVMSEVARRNEMIMNSLQPLFGYTP